MPPITAQELSNAGEEPHRSSGRFVLPGLLIVVVLATIDVVGGLVVDDTVAANVSGTFALAPALTALSRSPRHTLVVGVPAGAAAGALAVYDQVPWGTGAVRTVVVVASVTLSAVIAQVQSRQWAQLQDRRQAARTLQAAMLTQLPRPDHLQLVSRYLPASSGDQVGGDWYDAVVDADGATVLIIGDVVGHDIHAAAAMGQVRGLLRAYAIEAGPAAGQPGGGGAGGGQSPADLLSRADQAIVRLGLEVLATVVVVRVEQDRGEAGTSRRRLRWSNAGHLPPMLLVPTDTAPSTAPGIAPSAAGGRAQVHRLHGEPDLLLGLGSTDTVRHEHVGDFPVGSTLLLYTDGLVERRDEVLDEGLERLARAMLACAAVPEEPAPGSGADAEAEAAATDSLQRWVDAVLPAALGGAHQDDVAVLAVRAHPEDRPRPSEAGSGRPRPGAPLL